MNSKLVGMIIGLVVGVTVCIVIFVTANSNRKLITEYDERQKEVRGKGFKYGFYTALSALGVFTVLCEAGVKLPMEQSVIYLLIICLSVLVNAVYTIFNEGYWGLNNNKKRYAIYMILIALFNFGIAFFCYKAGILFHDGVIGINGINLVCAVMFIVIFVAIIIKDICDKKNEEGEEE